MKKGLSYRGERVFYKMGRGFKSAHYGMIFSKIMETLKQCQSWLDP